MLALPWQKSAIDTRCETGGEGAIREHPQPPERAVEIDVTSRQAPLAANPPRNIAAFSASRFERRRVLGKTLGTSRVLGKSLRGKIK